MNQGERLKIIQELDDKLLIGGVTIPEWCTFIVRETDMAFEAGADLAAIVMAMAGVETYIRGEFNYGPREPLFNMLGSCGFEEDLISDLQQLRQFRNKWVHVSSPNDDGELLEFPTKYEVEIEEMAIIALRSLRRVIYSNQWI